MPKLSMTFRIAACLLVSVGFCVLASASLQAQTWTETGDAGQTLGTAQAAGVIANQALNQISGTISSGTDADLFRFTITAPTTFSATTTFGGLTTLDTALFLFNSSGAAIYTNDDASGASLQSTLPGGTSFTMSLAAGTYYLGISLSGNEPINLNSQLLFSPYIAGDSTSVRGAAGGINPTTLANFNGLTSFAETGSYRIDLTSAATVPEPSTVALGLVGAAALGAFIRKRGKSVRSQA